MITICEGVMAGNKLQTLSYAIQYVCQMQNIHVKGVPSVMRAVGTLLLLLPIICKLRYTESNNLQAISFGA